MIGSHKILITGGAGFIGSHLADALLARGCSVTVLDNFATGRRENLASALKNPAFTLMEGDIRNRADCRKAVENCDYVLHEAALGSVPRSIAHPSEVAETNVQGFVNMIAAAKDAKVKRFVYASSSSVYGDNPDPVKTEDRTGSPLSPYAATKLCNEIFAGNFSSVYGIETVGLRYFNVFGPRQNPAGPYAAVIPIFIKTLAAQESPVIFGDGSVSRDFTFVENVVHANLLALEASSEASGTVCNIACGKSTSLTELFRRLAGLIRPDAEPVYAPPRKGDIRHSLADISRAGRLLGYHPLVPVAEGLEKTVRAALAEKDELS